MACYAASAMAPSDASSPDDQGADSSPSPTRPSAAVREHLYEERAGAAFFSAIFALFLVHIAWAPLRAPAGGPTPEARLPLALWPGVPDVISTALFPDGLAHVPLAIVQRRYATPSKNRGSDSRRGGEDTPRGSPASATPNRLTPCSDAIHFRSIMADHPGCLLLPFKFSVGSAPRFPSGSQFVVEFPSKGGISLTKIPVSVGSSWSDSISSLQFCVCFIFLENVIIKKLAFVTFTYHSSFRLRR